MLQDGEKEVVNKLKEEDNNMYLEDVEGGQVLEWVESSGLSKSEAERIQPTYGGYTEVQFATSCGPLACRTILNGLSILGAAGFAAMEYSLYKYINSLYPGKTLKKGGIVFLGSYFNALIAITGVLALYALIP